ncbi:MAG TPA: hypothetical protein VF834_19435 [Streptosporangiaceae bacterium]
MAIRQRRGRRAAASPELGLVAAGLAGLAGLTGLAGLVGLLGLTGAGPAQAASRTAAAPSVLVRDIVVGNHASAVAVDRKRRVAWVCAGTSAGPRLTRISETSQKVTARVSFGASAIAVDPGTSTVWALDSGNGTMAQISEVTSKVVRTFSGFGLVHGIAVDPRTRTVWLTSNSSVVAFSEATHRVLHTIGLHLGRDQQPGDVAIDPRTGTVWVAIIPASRNLPSVWISEISESAHRIIHTYPYGAPGDERASLAVDSARGTVWVGSNNFGTATGSTTGMLQVIAISKRRIIRTFTGLPVAPDGLAIDSGTHTVLATAVGNRFLVMNELTGGIIHKIQLGFYPGDVAVDTGTRNVYVPIVFKGVVAEFHE